MAIFKIATPKWDPIDNRLIRNEISYILRPDKIRSMYYGGWNFLMSKSVDDIIFQFEVPALYFRKNGCILMRHFILSFDGFYEHYMRPEVLKIIGQRLCLSVFSSLFGGTYQSIFTVHEDHVNPHIHFLVNTVNLETGKILSIPPYGLKQIIQDVVLFSRVECAQMCIPAFRIFSGD